ncbi:ribosomal protein s6 kinase alpha-2 isoform x1 [Limosa lapponica baueri]|uniref:Ribosomal protein s6 kinase alpha-2 isoform x1 n=1 Tax=Limosa lapponica baueri TaxID=1758121 RepID=A0A2I0TNT6_LIMLA|nr:ribosomal protein s6 kinase alpha-2 isoform x1 [Limosa lapponica baueri]
MPIAHLLELWKGIEVEPMETEPVVEDAALDEEPVKEALEYITLSATTILISSNQDPGVFSTFNHLKLLDFKSNSQFSTVEKREKEKSLSSGISCPEAKKLLDSGVDKAAVCAVMTGKRFVIPSSGPLCEMELQTQLSQGDRYSEEMLEPWLDTI